ncbi:protein MpRLK-Pelle_CR4L4 [Marchantia polymorpha subsp. ruderalis]
MRFSLCRDEGSYFACQPAMGVGVGVGGGGGGGLLLENCGPSSSSSSSELSIPEKAVKLRVFSLAELEAATGRFAKRSFLGKGSHGCLYKGILKDGKLVSVKRQEYLQDEIAFNNELELLCTLRSHRFVNLLGFCKGPDAHEKLLVVEHMAHGSLHDVLHHGPEPLSWAMRVSMALQVAKALLALHSASPAVIHRDVKSANVMIDGKWNAKLGGFGLAFRGNVDDPTRGAARPMQPVRAVGYIETEADAPSRLSTKVDVFGFGVLLLELLSGRRAIDVRHKPPSIIDWALPLIKQGKAHCVYDCRLPFQPQFAKALRLLAAIAARCVRRTSLRRPSMLHVVAGLLEVSKRIPVPRWLGLANAVKRTAAWQLRHGRHVNRSPEFRELIRSPRDRSQSAANYAGDESQFGSRSSRHGAVKLSFGQGAVATARVASMDRAKPAKLPVVVDTPRETARASSADRLSSKSKSFVADSGEMARARSMDRLKDRILEHIRGASQGKEPDVSKELPREVLDLSQGGRKRTYNQWRNPVFDARRSPERVFYPTDLSLRTTQRPAAPDGAIPLITAEEARAARVDPSACMPHQALRVTTKIRSRSVKTSTRKSHLRARASFEREEALLPW